MRYKVFFIFALCFLLYVSCFMIPVRADETSDKIAELRIKIEELTKQAEQYRGNILTKQAEANTLKRQIDILNNQILRLESEIGITERRITTASIELIDLEQKLFETQKNIELQKDAIAEAVNYLREQDRTNLVATFIKNSNFSDFANGAQRVTVFQNKLHDLLISLRDQKTKLEEQKASVESKKQELENLNQQQTQQKVSLSGSKSGKAQLLKNTKGQESQYQKMLNEVEKQKAMFFSELQNLENNAIANGTVITHVTATAVPPRGTKIFKEPYHDQFYVTQGYGMTSYAKRGAYGGAIHNGRDAVSGCASPIYAIGTGVVLASGFNNGFGNWVAVKQDGGGGMVSLYGHMVRGTTLPNGTPVTTDTVLGFEGTTGTSTGCHLHLSLYKDFFTYINPKNNQLYFNYADGSVSPMDYVE